MRRLRKIIFWCHLSAGVLAGVVILVMSVTGVLLTYERQIIAWADTRGYEVSPPGGAAPAEVGYGRDGAIFLNPYTGEVLGEGSRRTRAFFQTVTDWHRWLGANGERRAWGRAVTGACNLAFLFIVASGFYLWWPRKWTRAGVRGAAWFR
ncbi:MAG TPA: PepSY-associated TM helix domain-containing protein, partial [Pyrinomonadaceae bacterium]